MRRCPNEMSGWVQVLQKTLSALGWGQLGTWSHEGGSGSVVRMLLTRWLRNPAALAPEGLTQEGPSSLERWLVPCQDRLCGVGDPAAGLEHSILTWNH